MVSERLVQRHGVTVVDTELPGLVYFQGPASPTNLPPVPPHDRVCPKTTPNDSSQTLLPDTVKH